MAETTVEELAELLAAARAVRRRVELDDHAAAVTKLETRIDELPAVRDRELFLWATRAERLRDVGYHARDEATLRAAAEEAAALPPHIASTRPEIAARMRLAQGQVAAALHARGWVHDAERELTAAARLFIEGGEREEAAATLALLAWSVQLADGGLRRACDTLTEALSLTTDRALRASFLSQRAKAHVWLGRLADAQADVDAAWPMALEGDARSIAYVAWAAVLIASLRGQPSVVEAWVQRGDDHRRTWADSNVTGLWYDAVITDALARVGDAEAAKARLEHLLPHADLEPEAAGMAQIAVEARWGTAEAARTAFEERCRNPWMEPWEAARLQLLCAFADQRAGRDPGPAAAEAFDLCASLDEPAVLLTTEPEIAAALLESAAGAGSIVARRLLSERGGWRLQVLGGFALRDPDGQVVDLPGRVRSLLSYLAVAEQPVPRREVSDWLWPDESEDVLRKRLRQLLHRTKALVPSVIDAGAERLCLAANVTVDLTRVRDAVARARAAPDDVLMQTAAREAVDHLKGPLLPDEVIATDWLQPARARLALDLTWLHTVLAEQDEGEGHPDRALTHALQAVEADPTNESAAALAIDLLVRSGRRGEATVLLRRVREALSELELPPGPQLQRAQERIRPRGPSTTTP